eukprot:gnl/MRDRNA2_/MRDRNA2_23880_c0_seq1.p1 gnl/MRDRNA2_/MRDRNA2_23880_c0~~gnl/MRDRNA2_/MRDRNA2_23880_c0_seq1.p1  ORF type:complete len:329 (+),score=48.19 gnl/MRDRNA2_/MRDRNA2_23880_c0_seq1:107-988(+)
MHALEDAGETPLPVQRNIILHLAQRGHPGAVGAAIKLNDERFSDQVSASQFRDCLPLDEFMANWALVLQGCLTSTSEHEEYLDRLWERFANQFKQNTKFDRASGDIGISTQWLVPLVILVVAVMSYAGLIWALILLAVFYCRYAERRENRLRKEIALASVGDVLRPARSAFTTSESISNYLSEAAVICPSEHWSSCKKDGGIYAFVSGVPHDERPLEFFNSFSLWGHRPALRQMYCTPGCATCKARSAERMKSWPHSKNVETQNENLHCTSVSLIDFWKENADIFSHRGSPES